MPNFYERLKQIRIEKNMSIRQVSCETGLSYRTIQSYELQDRTPAVIETLIKLADFYDVSLDYLCGRSDEK